MSNQRTGGPSIINDVERGDESTQDTAINLSDGATTSGVAPEPATFSLYDVMREFNDLIEGDSVIKEMFQQRRSSPQLDEFNKVYEIVLQNPDLLLPITQEQYDGIVAAVAALRGMCEADRAEREREKEEENRKRREKIHDLEKGFLIPTSEDEGKDIPEDLILCLKCRESGHSFRNCTLSLASNRPHATENASSVPAVLAASKATLVLPKRIPLKTRKLGDPLLPCQRCQTLPILDLLTQENIPKAPRSNGVGVRKPVKTSSGLTYIEGMADEISADSSMLASDDMSGLEAFGLEGLVGNNTFRAPGVSSILKVDLGWAISLTFQQDCPLCVAMLNSMPNNVYSRDAYVVLCSIDSRYRYIQVFSRSLKAEGEARCLFALLNNDPEIDEGTWAYMDLGRIADAPDAIQLVRPTFNKKSTLFSGMVVRESGIDVELVRSWVSRCTDHHNETCRPLRSDVLERIRVIDVVERRLVTYTEAGSPEYIALSYVWGLDTQPEFPGTSTIPQLPATLEDAMKFVRILGTRYIWIDSICINQQDARDKEVQVQIMDAIYTGAWLTIVAISSDSMNSGMPRVEGSSKGQVQIRCHFGDDILVSVGQTLRQQISQSRWGTRAWTYQEALLSPRCLYIANEQVYFECNSASSCETVEDASSPYHSLDTGRYIARMRAGAHSLNFRNPFIKAERERDWDKFEDWSDALYAEHPGQYLNYYVRQLKQYLERKMTRDSDSLNAFGGMLKRLELSWFPQGFFQGVPIEHLSRCLMWEHLGQRRRREGFPAWSWAGWEGTLSRVHCFDEQPHIPQPEKNEWQRPLFKAYRAFRGQLKLIFESSSTDNAHKAWHYTSTCIQEQLAELSGFAQSTPPGYDKALPELRRMMLSKPNLTQEELDTPIGEIFSDLAGWTVPEALSSQSKAREGYFDRRQLPYDPFWVLAQVPCLDNDCSPEQLDEGERMNHLFVDCLTITLQIDVESPQSVEIVGIECDLSWYMKAPKDQLVNGNGQSDFIVLARDSGTLQLLMVDIRGKIATRVAPVKLQIPAKAALEKVLQDGGRITKTRLLLQGFEGWDRNDGKENWESDDFHGILIANGVHPRRRRLILV